MQGNNESDSLLAFRNTGEKVMAEDTLNVTESRCQYRMEAIARWLVIKVSLSQGVNQKKKT